MLVSLYASRRPAHPLHGQLQPLLDVLPAAGSAIVVEQVTGSPKIRECPVHLSSGDLSIAGWSANAGIKAMFDALNVIYDEPEKRSFIRLNLLSLATTVSAIMLLILILFTVRSCPRSCR